MQRLVAVLTAVGVTSPSATGGPRPGRAPASSTARAAPGCAASTPGTAAASRWAASASAAS